MEEEILNLVSNRQHVSMVELCQEIEGFKGELEWYVGSNTVIWSHCSIEAIEAMSNLTKEKKIMAVIVSPMVYLMDGAVPIYPIARSQTHNYAKPHWMPIVFSTPGQCRMDGTK